MIIWITGNSNAGKTTLAKQIAAQRSDTVVLDGDELWQINREVGLSFRTRENHNLYIAHLAKLIESQGMNVVVALICPYKSLRKAVQEITGCTFIPLGGGEPVSEKFPYEYDDEFKYFLREHGGT